MRAFVCIDGHDWEMVTRGVARYMGEGEAVLAHVADERAPRGYELSLRGLLGRRDRRSEERMALASRMAAEELLADVAALLERLRPGLTIKTVALSGPPNEELMRAAREVDTIFVGRGVPGARSRVTISGVVRGWRQNPHGDTDGLYLDDGVEVRFPPHKAEEIQSVVPEGTPVEASGAWRGRHLHAYAITELASGASVEAHKPSDKGPGKSPLGHTARFVVDHALCDVVVLYP
jgi:nucleotide-binding universal stress UspA family protein